MNDINSVTVGGRLTSDVGDKDFAYLSTGTAKLTLHLATNHSIQKIGQWIDETSFLDVCVWGKYAENLKTKVYKGVQVVVSGAIRQDRWKDQSGQNKSKMWINADVVQVFSNNKGFNPKTPYPTAQDAQNADNQQTFGGDFEDKPPF